ncbi:MAG TPA: hypothetical protein VFW90_02345 [Candidatus Saccharimonadales bacterium]|nr:hypothetical protein [Candidatus Saccharimonadales bacterium]
MSRNIAHLLAEKEEEVRKLLDELEEKNGWPDHDARMLAETIQKTRIKLAELGLDPDDTTGEELYEALLAKFSHDSLAFDDQFDVADSDYDHRAGRAIAIAKEAFGLPEVWALKNSAGKNILRQHPPKRLMKHLNYRSIESLLKREDIAELFIAIRYLESDSWLKAQERLVSKLSQTDFHVTSLRIIKLQNDRWSELEGPDGYIVSDDNLGAIGLWPSAEIVKAPLLSLVLVIADSLNRYSKVKMGDCLGKMSPVISWWSDMDHLVADLSGQAVALSLRDTALNQLGGGEFETRTLEHSRRSFWQEMLGRYEKQLEIEPVFKNNMVAKPAVLRAVPEPVLEFAEDV